MTVGAILGSSACLVGADASLNSFGCRSERGSWRRRGGGGTNNVAPILGDATIVVELRRQGNHPKSLSLFQGGYGVIGLGFILGCGDVVQAILGFIWFFILVRFECMARLALARSDSHRSILLVS
jgi:hypothetical protein